MKGSEIYGGTLFSKDVLETIYKHLSNINFCAARPVDMKVMGEQGCLNNVKFSVARDIPYLKVLCPETGLLTSKRCRWW